VPDVPAHQFPHELDGHPPLAWMGADGVDYVVGELWAQLRRQVPGTGEEHLVAGAGVSGGPEPRSAGLDVAAPPEERMIAVLRRTRALVGGDELGHRDHPRGA
jgi:hypothetical protein